MKPYPDFQGDYRAFTTTELAKFLNCVPTHRDILTRLTLQRRRYRYSGDKWYLPEEECVFGWAYQVTPLEQGVRK